MVTPEKYLQYLQALIDRHSRDLSIILNALGIADEPSIESLAIAYDKEPSALLNLLSQLPEENYTGNTLTKSLEAAVSMMKGRGVANETAQQDRDQENTGSNKWIWFLLAFLLLAAIATIVIIRSSKS
jgi:hypothetical protein